MSSSKINLVSTDGHRLAWASFETDQKLDDNKIILPRSSALELHRILNIFPEKINLEFNSNHRLGVIGEGPQLDQILQFNCIDYLGLKNQSQIIKISKSYHAFCLPSIYEPWGVVIHEMTALGLPILSSNNSNFTGVI